MMHSPAPSQRFMESVEEEVIVIPLAKEEMVLLVDNIAVVIEQSVVHNVWNIVKGLICY